MSDGTHATPDLCGGRGGPACPSVKASCCHGIQCTRRCMACGARKTRPMHVLRQSPPDTCSFCGAGHTQRVTADQDSRGGGQRPPVGPAARAGGRLRRRRALQQAQQQVTLCPLTLLPCSSLGIWHANLGGRVQRPEGDQVRTPKPKS